MPGAHFANRRSNALAAAEPAVLSASSSFSSVGGTPRVRTPRLEPFPLLDWLAIGNHLFTIGSIGYFFMNFFRFVFGDDINSNISNGIANSTFFTLGIIFILSSGAYWVDILMFPTTWTRRKFFHPLKREEEEEEEEEYMLASSSSSLDLPRAAIRPMHITVPGGKESTLYEEDASEQSGCKGMINGGRPTHFHHRRKSSADEEDDEESSKRSCRRICPIRTETYCEIINLSGALLNSVSSALPYALVTFKADHGVSFDSVPLSIALMDFSSMTVWLISSLLVFYVWRRDKIATAEEAWEDAEEARTGMPREKRRKAEELERIAEDVATKKGKKLPVSAANRFNPKKVPDTWIELTNLQWWAVFTNVVGSLVYWSACIYGITISLAAARGKFQNSHSAHGSGSGGWNLTPQQVQGWVSLQRTLNLVGDSIYLACAICCELVYFLETRRELQPTRAPAPKITPSDSQNMRLAGAHLLDGGEFKAQSLHQHLMRQGDPTPAARDRGDEYAYDHDADDALVQHHERLPSYRFTNATITADSMPASHRHFELDQPAHEPRQRVGSPFESIFETRIE
jgi:hypothetical protein